MSKNRFVVDSATKTFFFGLHPRNRAQEPIFRRFCGQVPFFCCWSSLSSSRKQSFCAPPPKKKLFMPPQTRYSGTRPAYILHDSHGLFDSKPNLRKQTKPKANKTLEFLSTKIFFSLFTGFYVAFNFNVGTN